MSVHHDPDLLTGIQKLLQQMLIWCLVIQVNVLNEYAGFQLDLWQMNDFRFWPPGLRNLNGFE